MKSFLLVAVLCVSGCVEDDSDPPINQAFCGNGAVNISEECDDGNTVNGDGCSASCMREVSVCGDGILTAPEQCDDGNFIVGDGCSATCTTEILDASIIANWQLKDIATNQTTACPVGHGTAAVYSQRLDAQGMPTGTPLVDLFDCSTSTGTTALLLKGRYQVWLEITDQNNTSVYAKSLSAIVDLSATNQATFSAEILNDGGYFQVAWALRGAVTNSALTCAQAGASGGLEAVSTDVSNPTNSVSDIWNCTDNGGITAGLLAATYTVSLAALDSTSQSIGTASALTNKVINNRNQVTNLGTITVPIDGL